MSGDAVNGADAVPAPDNVSRGVRTWAPAIRAQDALQDSAGSRETLPCKRHGTLTLEACLLLAASQAHASAGVVSSPGGSVFWKLAGATLLPSQTMHGLEDLADLTDLWDLGVLRP